METEERCKSISSSQGRRHVGMSLPMRVVLDMQFEGKRSEPTGC